MHTLRAFTLLIPAVFACSLALAAPTAASKANEIKVTLFGQACMLTGPFSPAVLKSIHAISPEQIYPENDADSVNAAQIRAIAKKVRTEITGTPALLDRYREKLGKRMDEMAAFFDGWEASQKSKSSGPIIEVAKNVLSPTGKTMASFTAMAKEIDAAATATPTQVARGKKKPTAAADAVSLKNRLFEIYSDSIEPDPQEDFQRAIRKLNINYVCDNDEQPGDSED